MPFSRDASDEADSDIKGGYQVKVETSPYGDSRPRFLLSFAAAPDSAVLVFEVSGLSIRRNPQVD
jgi:hypothetical protein